MQQNSILGIEEMNSYCVCEMNYRLKKGQYVLSTFDVCTKKKYKLWENTAEQKQPPA